MSAPSGAAFPRATAAPGDPVIVTAGDIACATTIAAYNGGNGTATQCRQKHTSELILGADAVLTLGDHVYPTGTLTQFNAVYEPTWGRKKSVTYPTPGDHDYGSTGGKGYFAYFGVKPYYSFDIGSWHFISLNSEIDHAEGSAQEQWLRDDLASTSKPCIGAYWGTPRFSSGRHGSNATFKPFWDALYEARTDLVLSGDDHDYERFAKQTPDGVASADGIRQFVVGTGGRSLYGFKTIQPNSEVRAKVFGVLQLTLGVDHYEWRFLPESGSFQDSGITTCNAKTNVATTPDL